MNKEQLKKDRELLSSWKEKLVYGAPGSCSFCMSEDEGADHIVTLEDCEELLEAQARVTEVEMRKKFIELIKQEMKDNLMKCDCYVNRCECNDSSERLLKLLSFNSEQDERSS